MKKYLFLFIITALCLLGCGKEVNIPNIPFDNLTKSDFTKEEINKAVDNKIIVAIDKQKEAEKVIEVLKKSNQKSISFNSKTDVLLLVMRGNKGSCKQADIKIAKISRLKNDVNVEVDIDQNIEEYKKCDISMNPFQLVKLNKETFQYKKNLTYSLINSIDKKVLAGTKINNIPSYLQ